MFTLFYETYWNAVQLILSFTIIHAFLIIILLFFILMCNIYIHILIKLIYTVEFIFFKSVINVSSFVHLFWKIHIIILYKDIVLLSYFIIAMYSLNKIDKQSFPVLCLVTSALKFLQSFNYFLNKILMYYII